MNNFEQIETYLSGEMSAGEKAAFEKLLNEDAVLKKDFDEWVQTEAIVAKHEAAEANLAELKNTLAPLTKEYFAAPRQEQKGRVVSIKKYVYAAMAAAAVLLFFFLIPRGGDFENYDVSPMPGAVVRGKEETGKKGAQLFNEKKYAQALPYLQQNALEKPDDATGNFYYGVALLKTGEHAKALPLFEKLTQGNSAYKEDSNFFAALAAYKSGKKDIAANYASQVPETNHYYNNALAILKKIK